MTALLAPGRERGPGGAVRDQAAIAIYEGRVLHRRLHPDRREFAPKLFLAYVDLDQLPDALDRLPLWSARNPAPVHFRARDFLDGRDRPLAPAVRDLVEARLGRRPAGPVYLLAQLRTFGVLFNPLSVYYCWTPDGQELDAIVLEVTNTPWRERHWYVLDARAATDAATDLATASVTTAKAMHVSPFLPMDVDYKVSWTAPGPALQLRIEVEKGGTAVFDAELALQRTAVNRRRAVGVLVRYPMLPLRVLAGIYTHAARLLARGLRPYRHPASRSERTSR